ncbi:MAG: TM2 domain-containing protein [Pseudomonadota bacterium]
MDYNLQAGEGIISGEDNQRYAFKIAEWKQTTVPARGQRVDFDAQDGEAMQIYMLSGGGIDMSGEKNKFVAALLAFFLGGLGAHKFYLGYNNAGIIMLVLFIGGWLTSWLIIGLIPLMIVGLIAFIECIIYLVTDEGDFQTRYVDNERQWF